MAKIEQPDKDKLIILRTELAFQKKEKEELLSKLKALKKIGINKFTDTNLHTIFMQLPAAICMLRGAQHIFYMPMTDICSLLVVKILSESLLKQYFLN